MAPSRSPSPAVLARRSHSNSPQLTPRSKLRKMLAAIDSSDEESSGTTRLFRPAARPARAISKSPTPQADSSDNDDQDILRPRGRLAARMQAGEASPKDTHTPTHAASRSTPEVDTHAPEQADDEDDEVDEVMTRHPSRQKPAKAQTPTRERSPASPAASSPAMFVTPSKDRVASLAAGSPLGSGDEGELPEDPTKSKRFRARLLELREKRVREAEEKARREAEEKGSGPAAADNFINDEEDDGLTDDEGGHKLTQNAQARPSARKASKKALEEMHRETQRLNRNLQLAHEAKTKTKVTKASLFERFNFKPAGAASVPEKPVAAPANSSRPSSPVSIHHTDAETKDDDTPPTSPPTIQKDGAEAKADTAAQVTESMQAEANEVAEVCFSKLDKGKGKATAADLEKDEPVLKRRQFRVTLPAVQANMVTMDDDEEQLIVAQKTKLDALFDRVPARRQETDQSLHALRILAQIEGGSEGKDGVAAGRRGMKQLADNAMTAGELQASLHRRAREQARLERERRLEALRAKGVHVQTEEEREQELRDIEDIVARARREAEEIMLREKEETKKERKESGAVDPLAWDDSDDGEDGDFQDEEEQEVPEVELSGSEDEDAVMDEDEEEEDQGDGAMDGLVDEQADSVDESADQASEDDDADEDGGVRLTKPKSRRVKTQITVISDDEDDTDNEAAAPTPKPRAVEATPRPKAAMFKSPSARGQQSPQEPTSVLRSATKTFIPGLPVKMGESAGLGLTQIFAGTMDDSQANLAAGSPSQPMPTFEDFHGPNFSQSQHDELILNSQPTPLTQLGGDDSQGVQLSLAQSQPHGLDSLMRDDVFATATQQSDWLEPTQDEGFQHRSPLKRRFIEDDRETPAPSAVVDSTQPEPVIQSSPLVRKGKLRRKAAAPEDDDYEQIDDAEEPRAAAADAFDVLNKAAVKEKRRKQQEEFDRKKSKAKEMFEEQAEESEDEYAGLGGADGEDSDDDGQDVEGMIDDKTGVSESDKAKIAALYADRERASDEKQVEKLFRDITTGMLRRKRGNDYDLSDDDDGGEARRRMKRRQFAKMQKALFADERVSKVAENPRTSAFMRTIEDRGSDDEDMDDLLVMQPAKPESSEEDSQEAADESIPDSQPKQQQQQAMAPPPRLQGPQRRTLDGKKPSNLGEIRESLSNLLEDQKLMSSMISATDVGSDSEGEDRTVESSNKENQNPRRRAAVAVVDRISLKRSGSSTSEASAAGGLRRTGSGSRAAFVMAGGGGSGGSGSFKVPALLRRATSNSVASMSSSTTTSSTGVTSGPAAAAAGGGGGAGFGEDAKIKKNASKRSGINYFARETERLAALAEKERRREARKWKGAEGRSKVVGGLFSAGKFE